MVDPNQQSPPHWLSAYRNYLLSRLSKVQILGDTHERELQKVFVELGLVTYGAPRRQAEFLGMMDAALRQRFNPFNSVDDEPLAHDLFGQLDRYTKQRWIPDELLQNRMRAIITGAPGCGKTTLLKYLAMQAQERDGCLAIWLELKDIKWLLLAQAEEDALRDSQLILHKLWIKSLRAHSPLSESQIEGLDAYWAEKFATNEIVVLLDGFDEIGDPEIERSLNRCVAEFSAAAPTSALFISTRPYARHKLAKERLPELEIQPLSKAQIKAFLNHYYPDEPASRTLLRDFRNQRSLKDLLHVPLLLGVILSLYREDRFVDHRLSLYEEIVTSLIRELDLSSKPGVSRFKINDERLRLDFLKFLAFERLLGDHLESHEHEANRIVFSYDLLKEKAKKFLAKEMLGYHPRDLVDDVLATPLLRPVGAETFAFTHLTLNEYLAALGFTAFRKTDKAEAMKILCRAYYNPTIVEMEVLPMLLGEATDADVLYTEIGRWPESLTFTNFRLRARGLTYSASLKNASLSELIDQFIEFISVENISESLFLITKSLVGINRDVLAFIEARANLSFRNPHIFTVTIALGQLGSDAAVDLLISILDHENPAISKEVSIRRLVYIGLKYIASERTTLRAIQGLSENDDVSRQWALKTLTAIGSDEAVEALIDALRHEDSEIRYAAIFELLRRVEVEDKVQIIAPLLKDQNEKVRSGAVIALSSIPSDEAVDVLIGAMNGVANEHGLVMITLAYTQNEKAIKALIEVLHNRTAKMRTFVAQVFAIARLEAAVGPLIKVLHDSNRELRETAVGSLGYIGSEEAVDGLIQYLKQCEPSMRATVASALSLCTASTKAAQALAYLIKVSDYELRAKASEALKRIESARIVDELLSIWRRSGCELSDIEQAVKQVGMENAINALVSALQHNTERKSEEALRVLGFVGAFLGNEKALEVVVSIVEDRKHKLRLAAAFVLGVVAADKAINSLLPALNDPEGGVRRGTIEALAVIDSDRAVDLLIGALNHEQSDVRHATAQALGQMSVEVLNAALERSVENQNPIICQKAILAIGYHASDRHTLDVLRQMSLTHQEAVVRETAKEMAHELEYKFDLLGSAIAEELVEPTVLLDNESRERFLIGEIIKIVAQAGHIFRPTPNSDWGIDGEIEFKNNSGEPTANRVYLQLKSGDSHLYERKRDGVQIFTIRNPRHPEYWSNHWKHHHAPVLLVIRDSRGRIQWMNITEYLQLHGTHISQIEFQGEPFTAESVKAMLNRFGQ